MITQLVKLHTSNQKVVGSSLSLPIKVLFLFGCLFAIFFFNSRTARTLVSSWEAAIALIQIVRVCTIFYCCPHETVQKVPITEFATQTNKQINPTTGQLTSMVPHLVFPSIFVSEEIKCCILPGEAKYELFVMIWLSSGGLYDTHTQHRSYNVEQRFKSVNQTENKGGKKHLIVWTWTVLWRWTAGPFLDDSNDIRVWPCSVVMGRVQVLYDLRGLQWFCSNPIIHGSRGLGTQGGGGCGGTQKGVEGHREGERGNGDEYTHFLCFVINCKKLTLIDVRKSSSCRYIMPALVILSEMYCTKYFVGAKFVISE